MPTSSRSPAAGVYTHGRQALVLGDCLEWLASATPESIAGVITDPPYGLREYDASHIAKQRRGSGGAWRVPPSFDGAKRRPLPRFTELTVDDRRAIAAYFLRWGRLLLPVLKPGAIVVVATTPMLTPIFADALDEAGLECGGTIARLVRTLRGGDRPKGGEREFPMTSTMPRSCWEPWLLYRKPLSESSVARNMKRWGVGALAEDYEDVLSSQTTPKAERAIVDHPSLKPQRLLRRLVEIVLPSRVGTVLDTFAGSASTLAACEAVGVDGIGIERDRSFFKNACKALGPLSLLATVPHSPASGKEPYGIHFG